MRISDWIVRLAIFLLAAIFLYLLVFVAYPQYKNIGNQQPDRPSVSETINSLDNGRDASLDAEDYDDDSFDGLSKVNDGVSAVGSIASGGVGAAKDALGKGADMIGDGAGAAKDAISSTSTAIKDRATEAIAGTPSVDDLASLKKEQAKVFEEGNTAKDDYSPSGSTPAGEYMVVAGTYRQMLNAENELKKLKKLGYENATIAKFNKSTYASLIVDRFSSSAAAYSYKKALEGQGLDVYVHKKR